MFYFILRVSFRGLFACVLSWVEILGSTSGVRDVAVFTVCL